MVEHLAVVGDQPPSAGARHGLATGRARIDDSQARVDQASLPVYFQPPVVGPPMDERVLHALQGGLGRLLPRGNHAPTDATHRSSLLKPGLSRAWPGRPEILAARA